MAAPILRRYSATVSAVANAFTAVGSAVPASRALVISKITVTNGTAASSTFTLRVGGAAVAQSVALGPGGVYTENGLVALAGESVDCSASVASSLVVSIFGEETDN